MMTKLKMNTTTKRQGNPKFPVKILWPRLHEQVVADPFREPVEWSADDPCIGRYCLIDFLRLDDLVPHPGRCQPSSQTVGFPKHQFWTKVLLPQIHFTLLLRARDEMEH